MKTLQIFALIVLAGHSDCAKILGVFPSPGYSQFILAEKLMTTLADRGHQVTVIAPFAPKNHSDNYRTIFIDDMHLEFEDTDMYQHLYTSHFKNIYTTYTELGITMTEALLKNQKVQKLLQDKDEKFDLVIVEIFINEAHFGFAAHFKAPLILFSSLRTNEWINYVVGNPAPTSYVPNSFLGYTTKMGFAQRFWNTVFYLYDIVVKRVLVLPKHEELLRKYFPELEATLSDITKNVSLVLLNSHPAVTEAIPMVPNMVEIGGFHVDPKPLPKDLKEYLDESKNGAIFFSMGSNLKSKDFSEKLKQDLLQMFSKLKMNVLWKFEDEDLPGKPKNVRIDKWLPQSSILNHPNTKLFISHCGLLSSLETVYSGVPVVCIPIFGDQPMNAAVLESGGLGVIAPYKELNGATLETAIKEVLNNKSYKANMLERSKTLRDNPMHPLESAMFWIEYVIRHKGISHLRSSSYEISWYQYFLLDIISVLLLAAFFIRKLIAKAICIVYNTNNKQGNEHQMKKVL